MLKTFDANQLLDPAVYPHPVESVQILETHISWVILTGKWAYKLKKPVNFGFLDYSTLEKRRDFCREELRLNGRLAPQIYVDVVALTEAGGRLRFEGSGPALEYAVKMRQFPQESLYDRQLSEGRLGHAQMDLLGRFVAQFHERAARVPREAHYGEPDHIQGPARDNFVTLLEIEPHRAQALAELRNWTEAVYPGLAPLMAARKTDGFVRELHGDLHLGNIAEMDGLPLPFDGIEFNPELRWIDTTNDLAFLVSDLRHRGRPDLGRRLLDAYLEESGDYAGLALWNYYLVYRWLVRAKVLALRKGQGHPEVETDIGTYLNECLRCLGGARPRLMITHGLSGSGKTFWSQKFLETEDVIRLRSDVIRKRLHGLAPQASSGSALGDGIYSSAQGDRTYRTLAELAGQLLRQGFAVLVDATFLKRAQRDLFRDLAAQEKVPFELVHLEAPPEVLRQRLEARRRENDASEAGLEVLDHQLRTQEPLQSDETARTP